MNIIDLHTHTTASDGTYSPEELVDYAVEKNLSAIAITDHDTIDGISPAKKHCFNKMYPIEIVSGIEFSTSDKNITSCDIHILGLYVDENNNSFVNGLKEIVDSRNNRNVKMISALNKMKMNISMEEIGGKFENEIITRAHFANTLLAKGYVNSYKDAFEKYIGYGKPAYVKREKVTPKKAIDLILSCGGLPVIAHPTLYNLPLNRLEDLIKDLKNNGLMGIEGIYSLYSKSEERYLHDLAKKYDLVITGGSDFHGNNKKNIDLGVGRGSLKVPYTILENIKSVLEWERL